MGFNNFGPENYPAGSRSYMDVETGDITIVNDNGCGGSIFHIRNNNKDDE